MKAFFAATLLSALLHWFACIVVNLFKEVADMKAIKVLAKRTKLEVLATRVLRKCVSELIPHASVDELHAIWKELVACHCAVEQRANELRGMYNLNTTSPCELEVTEHGNS